MQGAMESGTLAAKALLNDFGIFVEPDQPGQTSDEPEVETEEEVEEEE
jgi:hypothetical protein